MEAVHKNAYSHRSQDAGLVTADSEETCFSTLLVNQHLVPTPIYVPKLEDLPPPLPLL